MSTENDAALAAAATAAAPAALAEMTPEAPAAVVATAEEAAPAAPAKTELSPAQCAARLAEMFPALFGTQGPPKPIKLRIQADIQQRAPGLFTRKALSIVLHRHTTSTPYLKALVAAPTRFDLDGAPAGEIADEHRQAAREEVERRRAIVAARRAAEGKARIPREPRGPRPPRSHAADGTPVEGVTAVTDLTGAPEHRDPGAPGAPGAQQREATRPHTRPSRDRGHREGTGSPGGRPPRGPHQKAHQNPRPDTRQGTRLEARHEAPRPRPQAEAQEHPGLPEDPARRERALLLRTFEASPLTKANFCVLKRVTEAELDAQLALARQERGPARPRP
jgi:hypothetical protein